MRKKRAYLIMCPVLIVLWLFPILYSGFSLDYEFVKTAAFYLLFLIAALNCRLLPNRHAALLSASAVGVGCCALYPAAVYDLLPVLLLFCWLRCYLESEKGNPVRVYHELFTDLIYASLVFSVSRLFRSGYSFISIPPADSETIPELCMAALVLIFFLVLFVVGAGGHATATNCKKEKRKKAHVPERRYVGLIPAPVSLRTFWCFCVLLLTVSLLQDTNSLLIAENSLFLRSGFRMLFLPWMVLLFAVLDVVLPNLISLSRALHGKWMRIRESNP